MGTRGHRFLEPCPHEISLRHSNISLVGTMGMMFSVRFSRGEKRIFSIQENHPAHGARAWDLARRNISEPIRFLLIGSLGHGIG